MVLSIAGALGRSALIAESILPANVNQALSIIRLDQDARVFPPFLALALRCKAIQSQVNEMRAELAQANLSLKQVADLRITLPTAFEQQAIAGKLDAVNEAVERAREERAGLKALKASVSDALLTGRVRVEEGRQRDG